MDTRATLTGGDRLSTDVRSLHSNIADTDPDYKSATIALKTFLQCKGNTAGASDLLEERFGKNSPQAVFVQKAAVGTAWTGDDAGWAESLADAFGNRVFETAAENSAHGRLTQLPISLRVTAIGTGASAGFVEEGRPTPVTQMALSGDQLPPKRISTLVVMTKELSRCSDPRAERIFEVELRNALRNAIDGALLSANAATDAVPAGLYNGLTPHTATSDPTADIRELVDDFQGDLTQAFFVGSPKLMASLNSDARSRVGIRGGELLGAPAIASRNAPAGTLGLIDASGVAFASGGDISVSYADEATVEMLDSSLVQDGADGTGASQVSLWQNELIGIQVSRNVNWAAVRPGSVAYISGAAW